MLLKACNGVVEFTALEISKKDSTTGAEDGVLLRAPAEADQQEKLSMGYCSLREVLASV
jgi:hypothetical protein